MTAKYDNLQHLAPAASHRYSLETCKCIEQSRTHIIDGILHFMQTKPHIMHMITGRIVQLTGGVVVYLFFFKPVHGLLTGRN